MIPLRLNKQFVNLLAGNPTPTLLLAQLNKS